MPDAPRAVRSAATPRSKVPISAVKRISLSHPAEGVPAVGSPGCSSLPGRRSSRRLPPVALARLGLALGCVELPLAQLLEVLLGDGRDSQHPGELTEHALLLVGQRLAPDHHPRVRGAPPL